MNEGRGEPTNRATLEMHKALQGGNGIGAIEFGLADQDGFAQWGLSPLVTRALARTQNWPKVKQIAINFPPAVATLERVSEKFCDLVDAEMAEAWMMQAVAAGIKASERVHGYTQPAWPMRVAESFCAAVLAHAGRQVDAIHEFRMVSDQSLGHHAKCDVCRNFMDAA